MSRHGILTAALLATASCSGVVRTIPKLDGSASAAVPEPRALRIGTARVDMTPPPGPSTFGHGPDAIATQGYWTRLECRVFVVEAAGTGGPERFAVVPCDLPAISYALYRDVAERAKGVVPGDHLLVTATHTHAGPAHYFDAPAYAGLLSTRRPGFDDVMLQTLSSRIASGIAEAASRLDSAELRWVSTSVWGLSRNRSLDAFELNGRSLVGPLGHAECPGHEGPPDLAVPDDAARTDLENGPCKHLGRACEAVDPLLETLEMRETSGRPLGSITFFAMHPTVLPAHNRLFGADAFGVASRELERRMRLEWAKAARVRGVSPDSDPLAAIVNTNEGDISPAWVAGDLDEARTIGRELADRAWKAHGDPARFLTASVVETRIVEADLAQAASVLHTDPERPAMLGQGSSHGASDHPTSIDDIAARLPDWDSPDGLQEPKESLLSGLQPTLVSRAAFPSRVPFSLWRVADRWIAAVPAELTLASGYRVRRALERITGAPHDHTMLAGLANGYMQYVATCEEYQLQRYEGGSTLYGPLTQSFISAVLSKLACELGSGAAPKCGAALPGVHAPPFDALPIDPSIDRTGKRFPKPEPLVDAVAQNACRLPGTGTPRFCFRWLDVAPGSLPLALRDRSPGPWLRVRARGATDTLRSSPDDPRSFVDDWTDDFEVRARFECTDGRFSYSALFSPTKEEWAGMTSGLGANGTGFVLVAPNGGADRVRIPFGSSSPACTRDELLFCTDAYDAATAVPDLACRH